MIRSGGAILKYESGDEGKTVSMILSDPSFTVDLHMEHGQWYVETYEPEPDFGIRPGTLAGDASRKVIARLRDDLTARLRDLDRLEALIPQIDVQDVMES